MLKVTFSTDAETPRVQPSAHVPATLLNIPISASQNIKENFSNSWSELISTLKIPSKNMINNQ